MPKITSHRFASLLFAFLIVPATAYAEEGLAHESEGRAREKTIYFPQFQPVQSVYNEDYMLFRIVGKLALRDECLRIVLGNKSYLLIWPGWYTFDIINRDIVLTHLQTGSVVAQLKLGNKLSLIGGELENRPFGLKYSIPNQCEGPYLAVGEIESVQSENKSFKAEKHLKDSNRFSYPINQWLDKQDKGPSNSDKEINRSVNEPQKSVKAPPKPVTDINKPSKILDNIDDKEFEKSILK